MAEQHDADRDREPQPIDEEAAWAAIVAGYGEEPVDPPGARPFKSVEDLAGLEKTSRSDARGSRHEEDDAEDADGADDADGAPGQGKPLGSSIVFAPGVGPGTGPGPRDYEVAAAGDDDLDDEGHFVPPEPPPLPEADATAKFAWLAVIGGPVLLLLAVLLQWDMTWWLTTLCVGGFLGGFVTLVARMPHGDDEDDDPGRGAVV
ncbi:hypothetical protein ACFXOS_05295 [Streptomyces sp. NPDC059175]|uniref:hypothetical protein n=1 Tax=Streptomyces sp. NPDC059175 TaxID=3346757 RepID=UPI0036A8BB8E